LLRRFDTDQSLVDAVVAKLSSDERAQVKNRRYRPSRHLDELFRSRRRARLAKHRFVQANLRLVVHVALRYGRGLLPLADRIQEGNLGLMRAVDLFDPNRGAKFSTYASLWIRQAIARAVAEARSPVHVPASTGELMRGVGRLERQLTADLGRRPEREELAEASGIEVERLESIMASANPEARSLDAPRHDEDDRSLSDLLSDQTAVSPEFGAIQSHQATQVAELLEKLRPREKHVLMARFGMETGKERTLEEIARELHLTRERVRQIQNEGLAKLRRMATHLAE
jgi:RNA polymerase primary sigma factor